MKLEQKQAHLQLLAAKHGDLFAAIKMIESYRFNNAQWEAAAAAEKQKKDEQLRNLQSLIEQQATVQAQQAAMQLAIHTALAALS